MIHARRLDSLWGLMAQCALAVNWFNPLAWLAIRQFRREQERSCDDAVVLSGTAATIYAAHLVELARSIAIPEPALGMAERFDLEGRVHALLDPARKRGAASRMLCAALCVAALLLIVPLAAVRAQTVSKPQAEEAANTPAPLKPAENSTKEVALNKPARPVPARPHPSAAEEPQTGASVAGSVFDPSGAVIPSSTISLKNTASSNEEVALTDSDGAYKLRGIPPGEYLVKVRARGFATYQKTLTIEAGVPTTVDVHLALGDVEEAMVVTASKSPEGAAASNATPQRIRVGGMVQALNLIRKVTPMYPPDARAEGVEGTVLLRAIVSKIGSLLSIVPVNTSIDPRLVSAAVGAVSQWQYQPTLLNGEPVEVITTITVSFRLN
jgi:TonB family protein